MKKLITLIVAIMIALTLVNFQCNDNIVDPPPGNPPGYQFDIPWPSLADSPWPMNHHDPQSTGRSKFIGPRIGEIEWIMDSVYLLCSVAIGGDTTIYMSVGGGGLGNLIKPGLYAISPDKEIKWVFNFPDQVSLSNSTPLIDSDGTIYCSVEGPNIFYAVNSDGTLKWQVNDINLNLTGINIGLDGTLFFIKSGGVLTALSNEGQILWTYTDASFCAGDFCSITFSPDGKTLYIYSFELDKALVAFDIESKVIKWRFGKYISEAPAVDNNGNLYVVANVNSFYDGGTALYSLTAKGEVRWSSPVYSTLAYEYENPIIDKSGNIYCAFDSLYSFDYEGNIRWKIKLCPDCGQDQGFSRAPLVCDADGTIYVTVNYNYGYVKEILAIDSFGNILWSLTPPITLGGGYSPAIGPNGRMYYSTYQNFKLISIK